MRFKEFEIRKNSLNCNAVDGALFNVSAHDNSHEFSVEVNDWCATASVESIVAWMIDW